MASDSLLSNTVELRLLFHSQVNYFIANLIFLGASSQHYLWSMNHQQLAKFSSTKKYLESHLPKYDLT